MNDLPEAALEALQEAEQRIASGDLPAASAAWRRARQLAGSSPLVPHRVALALEGAGHLEPAVALRFQAFRLNPQDRVLRDALVAALAALSRSGRDLGGLSPENQQALLDLLDSSDVTPEEIAPALLGLLLRGPALQRLLSARSLPALTAALEEPASQELLQGRACLTLLTRALQTYARLENLLTLLRRLALDRLQAKEGPRWLLSAQPGPLAALACQAKRGAFAWFETPQEQEAVEALLRRVAGKPPESLTPELLLLAAYRALPDCVAPEPPTEPWSRLAWQRLIDEPRAARRAGEAMASLTPISDPDSRRVAAQYEENPYPSWLATALPAPQPLAVLLDRLLPELPEDLPDPGRLSVLVAGCGTGLQAVRAASLYAGAEVTAIDLSRASLGYAWLRASERKIENLRFAQADILGLDGAAGAFDLIECIGVLHHLVQPLDGWRRLRDRLRPGGLMRIGLYRRAARERLAGARALAGLDPAEANDASLRQARARIRAAAGTPAADAVLGGLDFYDLNGLRDLLFHVQETAYDCDRLEAELTALKLEFLGIELHDPAAMDRFRRLNPQRGASRDLDGWRRFEQAHPEAFAGMYQFWCRPRATTADAGASIGSTVWCCSWAGPGGTIMRR